LLLTQIQLFTPPPSQASSPHLVTDTERSTSGCGRWVDTWATSLRPDRSREDLQSHCTDDATFVGTTLRQTLRVSLGASCVRLRVSNEYGKSVLSLTNITVALPLPEPFDNNVTTAGSSSIKPDTICGVAFGGRASVEIPSGAAILSHPIQLSVPAGSDISISIFLDDGQPGDTVTSHLIARSTTWFTRGGGDRTRVPSLRTCPKAIIYPRWFFISSVEAWTLDRHAHAVACFGDSITDRGDSELSMNDSSGRTDVLQARLRERSLDNVSLLIFGISGDRLWEGGPPTIRPRGHREGSKGRPGGFVLMGINDLGLTPAVPEAQDVLYDRLVLAYELIITKCHSATHRIAVVASTLMPFLPPSDDYPTPWPLSHPSQKRRGGVSTAGSDPELAAERQYPTALTVSSTVRGSFANVTTSTSCRDGISSAIIYIPAWIVAGLWLRRSTCDVLETCQVGCEHDRVACDFNRFSKMSTLPSYSFAPNELHACIDHQNAGRDHDVWLGDRRGGNRGCRVKRS
jgi:hypothetical protein